MSVEITEDEWRAELDEMIEGLRGPEDPGLSAQEIAVKLEISHRAALKRVAKQLAAGVIIKGYGRRVDSQGRGQTVPVYRPAPKK